MRAELSPTLSTLLAKYDVAGPRYTSYPPVPDWTGTFDAAAWAGHLHHLGSTAAPLALYLHLPFCVARCFYCGCNATVTNRAAVVDRYLDRVARELALLRAAIGARPTVSDMHWGGGTPNFLTDAQTERLMRLLQDTFVFDRQTECSVEADPRLVSRPQLRTYRQLGFSRISFGVQDLDPVVQRAIGREQPELLVRECVEVAREEGFTGINLDLIYGLPHQTLARFTRTIEAAIAMVPDRVACFGYAHVPWMRAHQRRIDEATLPFAAERFGLFRRAVRRFTEAGFDWIGIDHFALPQDPLAQAARTGQLHRNFMGYTTRSGAHLLGIGTSAISDVEGWLVQQGATLGAWQRDIDAGRLSVARGHVCSADDQRRSRAIRHLMCNAELPFDLIPPAACGSTLPLLHQFADFVADGLMERDADRFVVTPLGRFFLRNLAFPLDAYRRAGATAHPGVPRGADPHPEVPRFSRAL